MYYTGLAYSVFLLCPNCKTGRVIGGKICRDWRIHVSQANSMTVLRVSPISVWKHTSPESIFFIESETDNNNSKEKNECFFSFSYELDSYYSSSIFYFLPPDLYAINPRLSEFLWIPHTCDCFLTFDLWVPFLPCLPDYFVLIF